MKDIAFTVEEKVAADSVITIKYAYCSNCHLFY